MREGFLIGAHHGLTFEDVDRVCDLLIEYDRKQGSVKVGPRVAPSGPEEAKDYATLDL